MTIEELVSTCDRIYGVQDDRLYDLPDLFYYHQKWLLRFIENRKNKNRPEAIEQLIISLAWYFAIIDRLQINLQKLLEKRYPYKCPFCLEIPCDCENAKQKRSKKTGRPVSGNPKTIIGWQQVIAKIYPEKNKFSNLEIQQQLAIFHQIVRQFRQASGKRSFHLVEIACVDYFVEILKTANNLDIDLGKEFKNILKNGCFVCRKSPCECFYTE
jgi:hypothetical protein